ncbi:hypothetical protein HJG54_11570 [Leptolyngbya sp. NK1-12]|uniref:Uncharacterized protein n=1 Tax=Leptolyngbya sp. NK1-12 TaxID=2547451 RepID=A0AA96WE23_9CYAN|nr:hypothetical protein HJG54_11570 [Leptolyngbya sp. NK1-12]
MQITINLPDNLAQLDQATLIQEIAIALFQQQHITFDQAAQLARIPQSEFQQLLTNRNIDVSGTIANDPDDEPETLILESLRTSLQQICEGKVHPISELWDGIDV